MTAFCRHPGCVRVLDGANVSGVCRGHMHGPFCQCLRCTPPDHGPLSPADRRRLSAARALARTEGSADLLQPLIPFHPELKGQP